jgi:hypothetical protein
MTERFGALELPAATGSDALTDPALALITSFVRAAIESDLTAAWVEVDPTSASACCYAYPHNPTEQSFNDRNLPALYMWRDGVPRTSEYGSDFMMSSTKLVGVWVMPPAHDEDARSREPIFNGVHASVARAVYRGRHKAWVLDGDTYYDPQTYGSVLARHAGFASLSLAKAERTKLRIEMRDGSGVDEYDAIQLTFDLQERYEADPGEHGFEQTELQGDVRAGTSFVVDSYRFKPTLSSVAPASGAVGAVLTLSGTQLHAVTSVRIGGVEATFALVDECRVTAIAPTHAAGVVDVVVTVNSGATATLLAAFTYL